MAKAPLRERSLWYRRAHFQTVQPLSMESIIRTLRERLGEDEFRNVEHASGQVLSCAEIHDTSDGIYLRILAHTPGEPASVVIRQASNSLLGSVPPPEGAEYLDGDAIAFVKANDIILCVSAASYYSFSSYIDRLMQKTNDDKLVCFFSLQQVAEISRIQMIDEVGVKKISLSAGLYDSSLMASQLNGSMASVSVGRRLFGSIAKEFRVLFGNRNGLDQVATENIMARIVLDFDSRKRGGIVSQQRLDDFAKQAVSDQEFGEFEIELKNGERISSEDISLKKKVRIESDGKTVSFHGARSEIDKYYAELWDRKAIRS